MNEDSKQKIVSLLKRKTIHLLVGFLIFGLIALLDVLFFTKMIFMLLYFSVYCTAGAGLLFWLPLFYAIGRTACNLIVFISFPSVKAYANEYEESLDQFITGAKDKGFAKEKVISLLIGAGWKESQYKTVLDKYYS